MFVAALRCLRVVALFGFLSLVACAPARGETWAEKLGYPSDKIVLILHADDIGMCYEANQAAKDYLTAGRIQSAAMMVPCPCSTKSPIGTSNIPTTTWACTWR